MSLLESKKDAIEKDEKQKQDIITLRKKHDATIKQLLKEILL